MFRKLAMRTAAADDDALHFLLEILAHILFVATEKPQFPATHSIGSSSQRRLL